MDFLRIQSIGEIEVGALTLLGASSKKDEDSAIGLFGSGAKYAIANLLRNGVQFKIFSGTREVVISTVRKTFRNKDFDVITVDGSETSLTTTMGGEEWNKPFPVFRELYSNALDEGNADLRVMKTISGIEGTTSIFLEYTEDYAEFFTNFDEYFAYETVELDTQQGDRWPDVNIRILPKRRDKNIRLFRKGILSFWTEPETDEEKSNAKGMESIFNYDFSHLPINESRIVKNESSARQKIGKAINSTTDLDLFTKYVEGLSGGNTGMYEHKCLPYNWQNVDIHPDIKEYLLSKKFVGAEHLMFMNEKPGPEVMVMPYNLLKFWLHNIPEIVILGITSDGVFAVPAEPTEELTDKVLSAVMLLKATSYGPKLDNINIEYVTFDNDNTFAVAQDGKVKLSIAAVKFDVNKIAKIIIEELEHLSTGFEDSTREFQNHWIDLYFNSLVANVKVTYS